MPPSLAEIRTDLSLMRQALGEFMAKHDIDLIDLGGGAEQLCILRRTLVTAKRITQPLLLDVLRSTLDKVAGTPIKIGTAILLGGVLRGNLLKAVDVKTVSCDVLPASDRQVQRKPRDAPELAWGSPDLLGPDIREVALAVWALKQQRPAPKPPKAAPPPAANDVAPGARRSPDEGLDAGTPPPPVLRLSTVAPDAPVPPQAPSLSAVTLDVPADAGGTPGQPPKVEQPRPKRPKSSLAKSLVYRLLEHLASELCAQRKTLPPFEKVEQVITRKVADFYIDTGACLRAWGGPTTLT